MDGAERDLTQGSKLKASFGGWTPAGDAFYVLSNERDPRYFDVYRYDAKSYERKLFYRDETGYQLGAISDDGQWAAFAKPKSTSDRDIYLWNAATGETKHISQHAGEADYSPEDFDPDSRYLYYTTNDGTEFARVRRYELATGKHEEVEKAEWDVDSTRFSKRGAYRVTSVNEDGRTAIRIVETKTDRPLTLLQAASGHAAEQGARPGVVHGGPGGQTRKDYSALIQYLVNHGYVVVGINNRGSSGYGKTFYTADDQKHGREPRWDCVEGKKYLATLPYVDKDRIAIIGGSYGGYMVLAALSLQPDSFAVGVDLFGISNWVRTLEGIPAGGSRSGWLSTRRSAKR